jgi:hypothetical protein
VPKPSQAAYPFTWYDGWPEPLADSVVTLREAGIGLGGLLLDDWEWRALLARPVLSLRVDEHPATDRWTTHHTDGTTSVAEFHIPLTAVVVPPGALAHHRAFQEWVMETHGALGRLLVWDETERWWMVNEPDLELLLTCAPRGMFSEQTALPSLHPNDVVGPQEVHALAVRYGLV